MRLESGPAAYDRNYHLIILVACVALGAYFFYDYAIGYPKKNLEEARKRLALLPGEHQIPAEFSETPTQPMFEALKKSERSDLAAVHEKLGQPFAVNREGSRSFEYFVSAYGMAEVLIVRGLVEREKITWHPWYKSKDEIRMQLYCALFTLAVALYFLYRAYKAATLRAVINDEGMTYGGRRISFDDMLRVCDYSPKGWVDLYYGLGPQERRLRIDNQKIHKFDEIIDALCEIKGFEDPRAAVEEPEAAEPLESPAEAQGPAESGQADESAEQSDRDAHGTRPPE